MAELLPLNGKRVWVAGHLGMVGSAIVRRLRREECEILTADRRKVDLRRQCEVERWVRDHNPEVVVLAAAKVGGIHANSTQPAAFLHDNLAIQTTVLSAAASIGVKKLLFLGSSCIYPKFAPQPILETSLLSGPLEPTNEWYAIAKIAGLKLVQAYRKQFGLDFVSAMPTNLYGPGDNYDLETSHVVPALIRKAHTAKITCASALQVWGTGSPLREFMYVDDCADACVAILKSYSHESPINVGSGEEFSIKELAEIVCDVVGYSGDIVFDDTKPDGTPRKRLDTSLLTSLGWHPAVPLREGLRKTYQHWLNSL